MKDDSFSAENCIVTAHFATSAMVSYKIGGMLFGASDRNSLF